MASSSKRQQTMAKRNREQAVKEKAALKLQKKYAAAQERQATGRGGDARAGRAGPALASGGDGRIMMRGTMAWFNEVKGHGYIWTDTGERLYVSQEGFVDGNAPKGRCAGLAVEFDVATTGEVREAVGSVLVEKDDPPRARRRHRAGR